MKLKKYFYIVILMLTIMVGVNKIYAVENQGIVRIEESSGRRNNRNNSSQNYNQNYNQSSSSGSGCEIFGDKNDESSIRYLVNEILEYPKYIVPILVIVLGMLDLGKAVIAAKEDEMRKAQSTFIKRVLIGVVIFLVPVILDVIMYFMDLVLGHTGCGL